MIQMHALYVFLAVAGLLVAIFIYVASSTRHARDIDSHAAYGIRTKFFLVLLGVLVIGLGLTLGKTPYPKDNEIPAKVVFVVGKQFSFGLSDSPISNDEEYESSTYSVPVQVPLELVGGIPSHKFRCQSRLQCVFARRSSDCANTSHAGIREPFAGSLYPAREIHRSLPGVVRYGASPHAWGV